MKVFTLLVGLLVAAFSTSVLANNAAPLGFELGVATYAQVKEATQGKANLEDSGQNKFSGGKMLKGSGEGLGVDGLSDITFIFDKAEKLVGVLMSLPKGNFKQTLAALSSKYKLIQKQVPFVGNASASLRQGDSVIEVDAPHMSFTMEVIYLTSALKASIQKQSETERAETERRRANAF